MQKTLTAIFTLIVFTSSVTVSLAIGNPKQIAWAPDLTIDPVRDVVHADDAAQLDLMRVLNVPIDIAVPAGGNLQAALEAAKFGDTVILPAQSTGASFRTPDPQISFVLPAKTGGSGTSADYVTVTTSARALLPNGRVTLADRPNMAKIVAVGGRGAFQIGPNARHFRFDGLEITNVSSGTAQEHVQDLLGSGDSGYSRVSKPAHFVVDRCYIHPQEDGLPTTDPNYNFRTVSHGIAWNVADLTVSNSRLSGFFGAFRHNHSVVIDSEAIAYSTGPGPLTVHNNYIDSWYASILTGGADTDSDNFGVIESAQSSSVFTIAISGGTAPIAGDMLSVSNPGKEYSACRVGSGSGSTVTCEKPLVWNGQQNAGLADAMTPAPTPVAGQNVKWRGYQMKGITVTRNTFNVDTTFAKYWRAVNGSNPKGYIEFKNGIDILFEGNIADGWPTSIGFGLQNQSGSAPWSALRNIVLRNNLFKRYSYAFGPMSVTGYSRLTETGGNILVENNLVYGVGGSTDVNGNAGAFMTLSGPTVDGPIRFVHNTVIDPTNGFTLSFSKITGTGVFNSNIFYGKNYGNQCLVEPHITSCFTAVESNKNLIINNANIPAGDIQSYWWANSTIVPNTDAAGFTNPTANDYRLLSTSPGFKAGTDGKDMGVDMDALNAALGGAEPPATPTPTATPTPNASPSPTVTPTPSPSPSVTPTATPTPVPSPTVAPTANISGTVSLNGSPLPDVVVKMLRASDRVEVGSFTTKVSGGYSLNPTTGSSVVISPQRAGYTFTPSEVLFSIISGARVQDFSAAPVATPTPLPSPTPLPFCASGQRPGSPPTCQCRNGMLGNSGKCR